MSYRQSYRWTVGRSSLRSSRKLVSNERCDCSYCPPAIAETERPCVARTPHPQRRVLRGDGLFRPTADAGTASSWGGNIPPTACAPSSPALPHAVGIREPMETIRPKSKVSLIYWTSTPLFL